MTTFQAAQRCSTCQAPCVLEFGGEPGIVLRCTADSTHAVDLIRSPA